jgi:hypothetical protein
VGQKWGSGPILSLISPNYTVPGESGGGSYQRYMNFIENPDSRYNELGQTFRNDETSQPNNSAQVRDPGRISKQYQIPRKYCTILAHSTPRVTGSQQAPLR